MPTHDPNNERIKRRYFEYMREARGHGEASIDAIAKALHRFETYTKFRDFKKFRIEQAMGFKAQLARQTSQRTGDALSKATLYSTLTALRNFFHWLAGQSGFKKALSYSHADYFNLSDKEARVAKARRERPGPTLEQVRHVLARMPSGSEIERRNRALIAFAILTGARDGALASFKLKHVDLTQDRVEQDAREVKTKFSKTFTTYFFPVGRDTRQIVVEWIDYLNTQKLWGLDDPLFPATRIAVGSSGGFEAAGLARKHWSSATAIRKIFREAFEAAGLPYFNPHSFRNTLGLLGIRLCRAPDQMKAWSQNLGHDDILTTFTSYGTIPDHMQGDIIKTIPIQGLQPD